MWRAWGTLLLFLAQDAGKTFVSEDHEFSIQAPPGWLRRGIRPPGIVGFATPENAKPFCEVSVIHYHTPNPTPVKSFALQAREHVLNSSKGAQILEDKETVVGGRPAIRLVYEYDKKLFIKTAVRRTNLEYYFVDALMHLPGDPEVRAAAEKSVGSFKIVPAPLSKEEGGAHGRGLAVLKGGAMRPELLGERWHSLYLGPKKVGYERVKLSEAGGMYAFEMELRGDFDEGGKERTLVQGSFSPDARFQKVEYETTKEGPKERWQFRASATIEGGRLKASRDMNKITEEATLAVEEGVLLDEVADFFRRAVVLAGKGTYLLRRISSFEDEPDVELVEVNAAEPVELDGRRVHAVTVLCRVDRRRYVTYYFDEHAGLLRQGGTRDTFSIRASTKEEALKP